MRHLSKQSLFKLFKPTHYSINSNQMHVMTNEETITLKLNKKQLALIQLAITRSKERCRKDIKSFSGMSENANFEKHKYHGDLLNEFYDLHNSTIGIATTQGYDDTVDFVDSIEAIQRV